METNAVFISYRRVDSADIAGRIYDRLVERFGQARVFKDVDSIKPGAAFRNAIVASISQSAVELVVIGPRWLTVTSESSDGTQRRLDDPGDVVRVEIETALREGVPIIPVLVMGANMPPIERLPDSLKRLVELNGVPVRPDPDFRHDMDRVIDGVEYWMSRRRSTPIAAALAKPAPLSEGTQAPPPIAVSAAKASGRVPGHNSPHATRSRTQTIVAIIGLALVVGLLAIALRYVPQVLGTGAGLSGLSGAHSTATTIPISTSMPPRVITRNLQIPCVQYCASGCDCAPEVVLDTITIDSSKQDMLWKFTVTNTESFGIAVQFKELELEDPATRRYVASGQAYEPLNLAPGASEDISPTFQFIPASGISYTLRLQIQQSSCCGYTVYQDESFTF